MSLTGVSGGFPHDHGTWDTEGKVRGAAQGTRLWKWREVGVRRAGVCSWLWASLSLSIFLCKMGTLTHLPCPMGLLLLITFTAITEGPVAPKHLVWVIALISDCKALREK